MTDQDAPVIQSAQQVDDQDAGSRADSGQFPTAPTADRAAPANDPAEKELLCTICGLRACWQ